MANRNRTNPVQFYLSDDEQYILNTKLKASGMKSMSAFLRKLILYGYVYDVDYSYLRNYNTELGRISSSLNQIAKRVRNTIFLSSFPAVNAAKNTRNGSLIRMVRPGKHSSDGTPIFVSSRLPPMTNFCF